MKLKYLVIHCTDTPEGRNVGKTEIEQWHLGPLFDKKKNVYIYKGKSYPTLSALPPDKIGGVSISRLQGRGWQRVGYRDIILLNGDLVNLIPYKEDDTIDPWEISNGVAGINGVSAHMVYAGGRTADNKKNKDTRTATQQKVMELYVKKLIEIVPDVLISGHYQFDKKKECPSFDVPEWLTSIGVDARNIYKPAH